MSSVLAGTCCMSLLLTTPVLAQDHPDRAGQDIYRLYNENTGEHSYTSASDEKSALVTAGWVFEGVGWIAPEEGAPIYRLYNPNAEGGDHYYTTSLDEANSLVSLGWSMDNDANPVFYSGGEIDLYSAYNPNAKSGSHNYTTSRAEQDALIGSGWIYDQVAWKVLGEGYVETDPTLYERFPGQKFVKNIWGYAGGTSAFLTINADGTYRETNVRMSMIPGINGEYSEFTGKLSDPIKVDEYTWKAHIISSDLVLPVNTIIDEGKKGKKIMLEPFAGLYAPMDFYIASPDKPIDQFPAFVRQQYAKYQDSIKPGFPNSYVLYTPDGMTFMDAVKQ